MYASSSSYVHDRNVGRRNVVHNMPRRNVVNVPRKVNEPSTIYHACNASFAICRKGKKVLARKLGAKCKGDKTCIWVPKTIVTLLDLSTRKNGSNTRSLSSSGIPFPVSSTDR